jgi:hypothetical protein
MVQGESKMKETTKRFLEDVYEKVNLTESAKLKEAIKKAVKEKVESMVKSGIIDLETANEFFLSKDIEAPNCSKSRIDSGCFKSRIDRGC